MKPFKSFHNANAVRRDRDALIPELADLLVLLFDRVDAVIRIAVDSNNLTLRIARGDEPLTDELREAILQQFPDQQETIEDYRKQNAVQRGTIARDFRMLGIRLPQ